MRRIMDYRRSRTGRWGRGEGSPVLVETEKEMGGSGW